MTTIEIIRTIGKEFDEVPDEELEDWIELVSPMISKSKFGALYSQALAYLICHNLAMQGKGSSSSSLPPISDTIRMGSISAGRTSISFNNGGIGSGSGSAEDYALTLYGLQFLKIRSMVIIPITIAGCNSEVFN